MSFESTINCDHLSRPCQHEVSPTLAALERFVFRSVRTPQLDFLVAPVILSAIDFEAAISELPWRQRVVARRLLKRAQL